MEFHILGPLEVRSDQGTHLLVPQPRYRAVLCLLLLHAGDLVPRRGLADALWGLDMPGDPAGALRSCVYSLRKSLGCANQLRTRQGGYVFELHAEDALDLRAFRKLKADGLLAARYGDQHDSALLLEQALGLWRDPPLADFPQSTASHGLIGALLEERAQAREALADARLALGQHRDLIASLHELTASDPLRERTWEQLMLALYRSGNQAAALDMYTQARTVLAEECGINPGPGLQELHQRILDADPALRDVHPASARPRRALPGALADQAWAKEGGPAAEVPRQLPGTVVHFAGRHEEMATLTGLLEHVGEGPPGTVVISALCGTAGVGKTALAVQWSQQMARHFPDGQLYVNLRGYDPGQPMTAGEALSGFLRSLGVPGRDIPTEDEERAARYRSLLASRRMLIVLDNAREVEQVRPLLPGTSSCLTIVTSRDAMAGLVAREGARRLDLDALPLPEAVDLLLKLIGERAGAEPAATQALALACCRLPLALRVAAELAAARPFVSLAHLVAELDDQQRRLDLLDTTDPRTELRAVFSWSVRHLDPAIARAFRLVSLHPGPDLDHHACAALTDTTAEHADQMLGALARACLIRPAAQGRYAMHDLLRGYARELARGHDGEAGQHAALTRLFDYYLYTAAISVSTLYPAEVSRRPVVPLPATEVPAIVGAAAARAWLDAELASLVLVAAHTAGNGWPRHATCLSATLVRYLFVGDHLLEALTIHGHADRAASLAGDDAATAAARSSLGAVEFRLGRNEFAARRYRDALELYRATADRDGEAGTWHNLGIIRFHQGRYPEAADLLRRALAVFRERGEQLGEAYALTNLALVECRRGRYERALKNLKQALAQCRATADWLGEADALTTLGMVECQQGYYQEATDHLLEAAERCRARGHQAGEVHAITALGMVECQQGSWRRAAEHLTLALTICRKVNDRRHEAEALNTLGEVYIADHRPQDAYTYHTMALAVAMQMGDRYEQARASGGLGNAHHALGATAEARGHWREAMAIHADLGTPDADQLRLQLDATEGPAIP